MVTVAGSGRCLMRITLVGSSVASRARLPASSASAIALMRSASSADPEHQLGDKLVVGGVVTPVGVGQEEVSQGFGGSVCTEQRLVITPVSAGSQARPAWDLAILWGLVHSFCLRSVKESVVEDDGPARFRRHGRGRRRSVTPLTKPTERGESQDASLTRDYDHVPSVRVRRTHLVEQLRHGRSESAAVGPRQGERRRRQGTGRAQETSRA